VDFWAGVKRAMRTGFRILTGLFMAVVILGAAYWAWTSWQDRKLDRAISVTKTWPDITFSAGFSPGFVVRVTTRCSSSELYYIVKIRPDSDEGATQTPDSKREADAAAPTAIERFGRENESVTIRFLDEDGFRVLSHDIPLKEFTGLYSKSKRRIESLEANGTAVCNRESYARTKSVTVTRKTRV
jgi:hypothetical protein